MHVFLNYSRFLAMAIAVISLFSNCTITGMVIGSAVSAKQNNDRPAYALHIDSLSQIPPGTMVEVLRRKGKPKTEGWFVKMEEVLGDENTLKQVLIIDVPGLKKHSAIKMEDIKKIVKGERTSKPTIVGTAIGAGADAIFWVWFAQIMNEWVGGGH